MSPAVLLPSPPPPPPSLELDTLTTDPKARAVNNVLVEAAEQSLHYHASTLWTATVPMAVRPIAWPLLSAFPNKGLARLREGRSRLYMGAKTLAKNAMDRIGAEWKDEVNMERDFGEWGVWGGWGVQGSRCG